MPCECALHARGPGPFTLCSEVKDFDFAFLSFRRAPSCLEFAKPTSKAMEAVTSESSLPGPLRGFFYKLGMRYDDLSQKNLRRFLLEKEGKAFKSTY